MHYVFKILHTCNWWQCATADRIVVRHLVTWAISTTAASSPGRPLQTASRELLFLGGSMAHLFLLSFLLKGTVEHALWIAEHLRENQRPWKLPEKSLKELEDFLGWNRVSSSSASCRIWSKGLVQYQISCLNSIVSVYAPWRCLQGADWTNFVFQARISGQQRREQHLGAGGCLWIIHIFVCGKSLL